MNDMGEGGSARSAASANAGTAIDLRQIVDEGKINPYRFRVLFLIFLAMFADGYDGASISYAGPMIADAWHLGRGAMGPVFAINVTGVLIGGGVMGLLGDWIGRRVALIIGLILCGIATLGTVTATDIASLTAWRFVTGVGVGALSPICLVIANEYAPRRIRATAVAAMFLGFGAGGTGIGGVVKATLGEALGWQALFYFGAVVSIIVAVLLLAGLPESLKYLYVKQPHSPAIAGIVRKLKPDLHIPADASFVWPQEVRAEHKVPYRMLFTDGRWKLTLVLWVTHFCAQVDGYAMSMWLPTLLGEQHLSDGQIASAMAIFGGCGLIGAVVSARLMDKVGVITHAGLFLLGVPLVFWVGSLSGGSTLIVAIAMTGFSITGALMGMSIMVGLFYPTAVRSTGVGATFFVSRFGAVLGPVMIGWLISHGASVQTVFRACAVPLAIAAVSMFVLGLLDRPRFLRERSGTV